METSTLEPILKENPLFKGMQKEHIDLLLGCASAVQFSAEDVLFRQKEEADKFYIVCDGQLAVEIDTADRGKVTIQTVQKDGVLGWSWIFPPYVWHFDARATEVTSAIEFDGVALRDKMDDDLEFGYEMMKRFSGIVVNRLQSTRVQLMDLYGSGGQLPA